MSTKIKAEDFELTKGNKNFKKAVITRINMTNTFTIEDLEGDMRNLDRMERESAGQIRVSKAAVDNIERNHKFISKMSDEQLAVAAYLHETKGLLAKAEKTAKEVKNAKKIYREMVKTVYEKFGFVETELPKDEQAK